ncbi:MAG: Lrp/AsnC ligand binding domain-containing protein [Candidatus Odinarchaeia archaeon]
MNIDKIDEKIIEELLKNSRASYSEIAANLRKKGIELSEGAVRKRVKKMIEEGVIKRFTVELNSGVGVKAIILVRLEPKKPALNVSEEIAKIDGVRKIYEIAGPYDTLVLAEFPEVSLLNTCIDTIRAIDGVASTTTFLVLRERY